MAEKKAGSLAGSLFKVGSAWKPPAVVPIVLFSVCTDCPALNISCMLHWIQMNASPGEDFFVVAVNKMLNCWYEDKKLQVDIG